MDNSKVNSERKYVPNAAGSYGFVTSTGALTERLLLNARIVPGRTSVNITVRT